MHKVQAGWGGCVFVCTHERPADSGRASCGVVAGSELRTRLKAEMKRSGHKGVVLTAKSGCLGVCSPKGITVAAIPESGSGCPRAMWVVEPSDDLHDVFFQVCEALGVEP